MTSLSSARTPLLVAAGALAAVLSASSTASATALPYDQQAVNGSCITGDTLYQAAMTTDLEWVGQVPAGVWVNGLWVPSGWLLGHVSDYATCADGGFSAAAVGNPVQPLTTTQGDAPSPTTTSSTAPAGSGATTTTTAPVATGGVPSLTISAPYTDNGVQVVNLTWTPAGSADLYLDSNQGVYVADDVTSPQVVQVTTAVPWSATAYVVENGLQSNSVSLSS